MEATLSERHMSDFYHACASSDIPQVKSHLAHMSASQINRLESNRSTALHVACYNNNLAVVYLLIRHGASAAIKNGSGFTPHEETTSSAIKQLLQRTGNAACIEWTFVDPPTRQAKHIFDSGLERIFREMGLSFILDYLFHNYARGHVAWQSMKTAQDIDRFFDEARMRSDLTPLITAYTTATSYYKILNLHCVEVLADLLRTPLNPPNTLSASILYLTAACSYAPVLRPRFAYTGRTYRGVRMSLDYFRTYKEGELLVNRPFLSTSAVRSVADRFVGYGDLASIRKSQTDRVALEVLVRCTYEIRRAETRAIYIAQLSDIESEEEVLLMPISVFRVASSELNADETVADVLLEDCDLPDERDPYSPMVRCDFAEMPNIPLVLPFVQISPSRSPKIPPIDRNLEGWRGQLADIITNMSTRTTTLLIAAAGIISSLVLLAIILPNALGTSCNPQTPTAILAGFPLNPTLNQRLADFRKANKTL